MDNNDHADPSRQYAATKQHEMSSPHRQQDGRAEKAKLDRDGKKLIVRIDAGNCPGARFTRRGATKLLADGTGAMAE